MTSYTKIREFRRPQTLFCIGLGVVLTTLWILVLPEWRTHIHMWRVEIYAALFLAGSLAFLYVKKPGPLKPLPPIEKYFIAVPIAALIIWGLMSAAWAGSWRSAIHHSLVWCAYLIFYLFVRQVLETKGGYNKLIITFTAVFVLFGFTAIGDYVTALIFSSPGGLGTKYSKYAEQVNTIAPLVAVGIMRLNGRRFAMGVAAFCILWLVVFCSLSRAGLLLFIAGMLALAFAVAVLPRFRRYRLKFAVVAAAVIIAPLPLHLFSFFGEAAPPPMLERVAEGGNVTSSNNFRKLMTSIALEMIAAKPIAGIGADNFGFAANEYRAIHAAKHPGDLNLAEAESNVPERAHNEYLQIFAELGVVGAVIFASLLASVLLLVFNSFRRNISPFQFASILGLGLFLASSLVSSFSFRLIQNGFVFFFVLAVAAKLASKPSPAPAAPPSSSLRLAHAAGILACLLLIGYHSVRVASVIITARADSTPALDNAIPLYDLAMRLDNENPDAPRQLGLRMLFEGRFEDAVPLLDRGIRAGQVTSTNYSFVATAQTMSGDGLAAEATMAHAALLYPRSTFVLSRYSSLLADNGKMRESAELFRLADTIDARSARTWRAVLNEGPKRVSELAATDPTFTSVMELQPPPAVYAAVADRLLRNPDEQKFSAIKFEVSEK